MIVDELDRGGDTADPEEERGVPDGPHGGSGIPFEQTIAYFEANGLKRGQGILYMAYRDMEHMTKLPEKVKEYFASLFGKDFETSNDLLAWCRQVNPDAFKIG